MKKNNLRLSNPQKTKKQLALALAISLVCAAPATTFASAFESSVDNPAIKEVQSIQQQKQQTIKGIIKDTTGEPVIGASVLQKGTSNGTVTDIDGNFTLTVPTGSELQITYIGYVPQTVAVKAGMNSYNIIIQEDTKTLDEVVVVGYGIQQKVNLTGSVAQVGEKELQDRPIQNLTSGIQGLMPGVTITGTNGAPGMDGGNIRVRGVGTLNSSNPYILIDGVEAGTMNAVDPNDIASISVLKDAASAAIYGSKASNGVILITTKRGSNGAPKVSYNGYVSIQNATQLVDRLNSADYATLMNRALTENGKEARFTDAEIQKFRDGSDPYNYPNTDWYDLAYKTGFQHRHNVNVNGGSEFVKYMASIGYLHQTGVLPNAEREQFNGRMNMDVKISKKLTARANMAFIKNQYADPSSAYAGGSSDQIIRQLNLIAPWVVNKYEDGTYGTISDGNPMAWLDSGMKVDRDNYNYTANLAVDYDIFDGLKLTLQGAYVNNQQHYKYFQKYIKYNANKETEPNKLDERFYTWNRTNYDALLNYDKTFGKHGVKALFGWHTEKYNYNFSKTVRQNFPNNDLTDIDAGDASTQKNEGNSRELAMISWFGRINYDYAGKYLVEANIRADASSRFAKDHRWGYFPSFSGAWRISEEAFMEDSRDWLTNLKLRGSWGQLGNQDALSNDDARSDDYYPWMNTFNLDATYPFGGSLNSGFYQKGYRLSTISWEKATTWGIGVDFSLFNQLTGSIDYYNRKTTGIIMNVPVPAEFGLDPYKDNVGSMVNRGVEVTLSYNTNIGRDWTLGVSGNLAYNKNEILDLGGVEYMATGDNQRNQVGKAVNTYYMYKATGFFQSDAEADAYTAKYGNPFGKKFKAGDLIYADTDNNGTLDSNDRVFCNTTDPAITYGFNINVGYKAFDLSLVFNGAAKVQRIYNQEVFGSFNGDAGHPSTIWLNAWTPENTNAKMPRVAESETSPSNPKNVMSTFWLQNTSYLRLKNLQLGYNFPKSVLNTLGISNLRVYYSAENLLTFDKMPINIDPEATSNRASSYPLLRTHAFGLNVTF